MSIDGALICGINKSGSTLLDTIALDIGQYIELELVALSRETFAQGLLDTDWLDDYEFLLNVKPGRIFIGWRGLPVGLSQRDDLSCMERLLLIRDPRDALVSLYYSCLISHPIPNSGSLRKEMLENRLLLSNAMLNF